MAREPSAESTLSLCMKLIVPSDEGGQKLVHDCAGALSSLSIVQQTDVQVPPRASFLELPTELRLRIYDFLASTPHQTKHRHYGTHDSQTSCCGISADFIGILGINQRVRAGARAHIFQTAELAPRSLRRLRPVKADVRKIFILCDPIGGQWCFDDGTPQDPVLRPRTLRSLCTDVKNTFPNIQQVRLRIDHAKRVVRRSLFGPDAKLGLAKLPNLKHVTIESYVDREGGRRSIRAEVLFELVEAELPKAGKSVRVVHRFLIRPRESAAPQLDARMAS